MSDARDQDRLRSGFDDGLGTGTGAGGEVGATRVGQSDVRGTESYTEVRPAAVSQTEVRTAPVATAPAPAPRMPQHQDSDINVTLPAQRGDQVRWGPIWAGLIMVLPVFLLGELLFLALGVLDLGDSVSGTTAGIVTGLIALAAFFVGGLVAGATAMWRGVDTGLLHGILVWALGIVVILGLTIIGGASLLGSAGNIASQLIDPATLTNAAQGTDVNVNTADAVAAGKTAASSALLGLGLTIIASALGGIVGAKVWPRKKDLQTSTETVTR